MPDDHLDPRLSDYNHMNGGLNISRVHTPGSGILYSSHEPYLCGLMYRIRKYLGIAATDLILYVSYDNSGASCKSDSSAHAGSCRLGINDTHSIQIHSNSNKSLTICNFRYKANR